MNDAFTRRGFARTLFFGGVAAVAGPALAGLRVARAEVRPRLAGRITPVAAENGVSVDLHLRNAGRAPIVLLTHMLRLAGELDEPGAREAALLSLEPVLPSEEMRLRSGPRVGYPMPVAARSEVLYGRFFAPWPAGFARAGRTELRVRSELRAQPRSGDDARAAALRAMTGIEARVRLTLPS